jgi:superfamily I DNA/RNA helicase
VIKDHIEVKAIHDIAQGLYAAKFGTPTIMAADELRSRLLTIADNLCPGKFAEAFLWSEWNEVVDSWQLTTWEAYREVPRLGRKTRLGSKQRESLWQIFDAVHQWLKAEGVLTWAGVLCRVTDHISRTGDLPYTFAVVDEAQDMGVAELRFFSAIGSQRPDSLFFTGDLGQRIFQQPFSWKALGVDIRGRSHTLTINYRTSHQIRTSADRLLPGTISDVDGNQDDRRHTVSVFNGPAPAVKVHDSPEDEIESVGEWIANHLTSGLQPEEMGVFVRDGEQLHRAISAIKASGAEPVELDEHITGSPGQIAVSTMHLAKGLEFRAVVVMACDDEVIPQQERIETIADEADLEEVYNTERHLLYVALTRARDYLLVSGVDPASEFLDDL